MRRETIDKMNIWCQWLFAVVFLLAGGRSAAEVGNQVVVLTGARLIDGSGRPAVENSTLVIEGDKIGSVGPSSDKYPTEALVIDCSGKTIIHDADMRVIRNQSGNNSLAATINYERFRRIFV